MNRSVYLTVTPVKLFDESYLVTVITKLRLYCRHSLYFIFANRNWTFILLNELSQNSASNLDSTPNFQILQAWSRRLIKHTANYIVIITEISKPKFVCDIVNYRSCALKTDVFRKFMIRHLWQFYLSVLITCQKLIFNKKKRRLTLIIDSTLS